MSVHCTRDQEAHCGCVHRVCVWMRALLGEWIFTVLFTQQTQFILTLFSSPLFSYIFSLPFVVIWERSSGKKRKSPERCKERRYVVLLLHRFIRVNPSFYLVYSLLCLSSNSKKYELWRRNKLCLRLTSAITAAIVVVVVVVSQE